LAPDTGTPGASHRLPDDVVASGLGRGFTHGRPALVAYLMAGYPDRARSLEALRADAAAGADVSELGVPYADPLADAPVIVAAADEARANPGGFGLAETLALAAEFDAGVPDAPPIALMTYLNPMLRFGFDRLGAAAAEAGVAGFIVPDMPPDNPMAARWLAAAAPRGIQTVFLVAPTSNEERIVKVAEASRGFIYVVSSLGVTGERAQLPAELGELVARVKAGRTERRTPVAVGFGVSTPQQAAAVAAVADGVIVGTAIVRRQADADGLGAFVRSLAEAVHATPADPPEGSV
jgi:tryptophan synthase alpha chain